MKPQLITRALFFTLLFPVMVTIIVPYLVLGPSAIDSLSEFSFLRILACILAGAGWAILLHCIWAFAFYGKGTLAPIDAPKLLVIHGLYRFTRNPMYLAVFLVLLTEVVFFQRRSLIEYLIIVALFFHLFVVLYEEPHLRRQFGQKYLEYCRIVPRWGFSNGAFNESRGAT
jgi:protein-S-isoprenylcysteine O-methyltransferase Ste14